ncbi:hypothetical protein GC425_05960 [Corynebacterium sp. zg254]|uniref:BRCT domain-containing protein n=1 Tax=Corynebacterium zhongnanshanii TaxID=2768834 RepID=A0ABQ6VCZ8_9CORY|nr:MULTISPECIES: BRCT domain-containing protein [Corynebacterium]KAB3520793.1 hypothetical protein F8377_05980 [Corynebacterium zhongnanshanii]MCR5914410.1 hypothetical protein [Corynebacterium sp. zg254]
MHARGADIQITPDHIKVTRTGLANSLWDSATIPASSLIGWYKKAPDTHSPGHIDLLHDGDPVRINFSAGRADDFRVIDGRLTALQAGYPLDEVPGDPASVGSDSARPDSTGPNTAGPSAEEWVAEATESGSSRTSKTPTRAPWSKVATPDVVPETNTDADIDGQIYGQVVCVTGDVEPYSKGDVWNMIAQAGGKVSKSVTKKTTMLVVGEWASVTSKEKRARELKDKGQEINIVSFADFLTMV